MWLLYWYMWSYFIKTPLLPPEIILKYMYKCLYIFYLCVSVCVDVHVWGCRVSLAALVLINLRLDSEMKTAEACFLSQLSSPLRSKNSIRT